MTDHIKGGVVLTVSGKYFSLLDPKPEDVRIGDIAHALANLCRYTGHTDRFYSVAEHSVRCASYLRKRGYSPRAQMAALLHDASEAYIGDLSSPLKALVPEYRQIEGRVVQAVVDALGVDHRNRPEVHMADMQLLCTERHELMTGDRTPWAIIDGLDPQEYQHTSPLGWVPDKAYDRFMRAYRRLEVEIAELESQGR